MKLIQNDCCDIAAECKIIPPREYDLVIRLLEEFLELEEWLQVEPDLDLEE